MDPANWQHLVNFTVGLRVNGSLNPANGIPNSWPNPHDPDDKEYKNATYIPSTRSMICGTRHSTARAAFQRGRPRHLCCSPEQHLAQIAARNSSASSVTANATRLDSNTHLPGPLQQRRLVGATHLHSPTAMMGRWATWRDAATQIPAHTSAASLLDKTGSAFLHLGRSQRHQPCPVQPCWRQPGETGLPICAVIAVASRAMAACSQPQRSAGETSSTRIPLCRQPGLWLWQRHRPDPSGARRLSDFPRFDGYSQPYTHALRGANDGMPWFQGRQRGGDPGLHSRQPVGDLSLLTKPDYSHRYYVDGTAKVGDAYLGSSWKTVPWTGAGGKAVFAIDVTKPQHRRQDAVGAYQYRDGEWRWRRRPWFRSSPATNGGAGGQRYNSPAKRRACSC